MWWPKHLYVVEVSLSYCWACVAARKKVVSDQKTGTTTLEQYRLEAAKKVRSGTGEWTGVLRRGAKATASSPQQDVPGKRAAKQQWTKNGSLSCSNSSISSSDGKEHSSRHHNNNSRGMKSSSSCNDSKASSDKSSSSSSRVRSWISPGSSSCLCPNCRSCSTRPLYGGIEMPPRRSS